MDGLRLHTPPTPNTEPDRTSQLHEASSTFTSRNCGSRSSSKLQGHATNRKNDSISLLTRERNRTRASLHPVSLVSLSLIALISPSHQPNRRPQLGLASPQQWWRRRIHHPQSQTALPRPTHRYHSRHRLDPPTERRLAAAEDGSHAALLALFVGGAPVGGLEGWAVRRGLPFPVGRARDDVLPHRTGQALAFVSLLNEPNPNKMGYRPMKTIRPYMVPNVHASHAEPESEGVGSRGFGRF